MRYSQSFNPYSNGSYSGRLASRRKLAKVLGGFNPYSNGSYSGSPKSEGFYFVKFFVSILILMEVTLEAKGGSQRGAETSVSILILMEVTLEGGASKAGGGSGSEFQSLF